MKTAKELAWEHSKAHHQGVYDGFEEHGDEKAIRCLETRFRQAQAEALRWAAGVMGEGAYPVEVEHVILSKAKEIEGSPTK